MPYNVLDTGIQTIARCQNAPAAPAWRKQVSDLFEVRKLAPGVHVITELGQSHAYLVEGEAYAALIEYEGWASAISGQWWKSSPAGRSSC